MANVLERLKKLLGEDAANNILNTSPDDVVQDFPAGTDASLLTPEQQRDAQNYINFQAFHAGSKDQSQPKPDFSQFKPILDNIPNQGNSFLTDADKAKIDEMTNQRLGHPDLPAPNPLARKEFSQINTSIPYNELNKEDQAIIDSSVDDALQKDPTLINHSQDLGTANRAGQSLTGRYADLLPGNLTPPSQTKSGQINEAPPAGGPFAILNQMRGKEYNPEDYKSAEDFKLLDDEQPVDLKEGSQEPNDKDIINSYKSEEGPQSIASLENMLKAQQSANNINSNAGIMRGLDLASAGIAGLGSNSQVKPTGQEFYKDMAAKSQQPVEDYQNMVAMERHDPNSPISKSLRKYAQKIGFDTGNNVSAADIDKAMPYVTKAFDVQETNKARHEDVKARLQELNVRNAERRAQKEADDAHKEQLKLELEQHKTMGNVTDQITKMERNQDAKSANESIRLVANAQSLLDEYPDLNKMPQQKARLFVSELSKIVKGGIAGHSEVKELMPSSLASGLQEGLSRLGNAPRGAELGKFLEIYKPYMDTLLLNSKRYMARKYDNILTPAEKRLTPDNIRVFRNQYKDFLDTLPNKEELSDSEAEKSSKKSVNKDDIFDSH